MPLRAAVIRSKATLAFAAERQVVSQTSMVERGEHGDYRWFEGQFHGLPDLVVACHLGLRLAVSSFDSGFFHPTADETEDGWTVQGSVALSPTLRVGMELPSDQYDEWYVFDDGSSPDWSPEVFVNLGTFTVVPAEELKRRRDPSWEANAYEWLRPVQKRLWNQMERVRPVTYIAMGERDIVVTRSQEFASRLSEVLANPALNPTGLRPAG